MRKYSYDVKCGELAQHFLPEGSPEDVQELAQIIQDIVEMWFAVEKDSESAT